MLHVTIRTQHDPRITGGAVSTLHEGTFESVLDWIAKSIINAKIPGGVFEVGGSIEIVIQKSRVKVAGIPGRDK